MDREMIDRFKIAVWNETKIHISDENAVNMVKSLREPTEGMVMASGTKTLLGSIIYRDMIDAITGC